MGLWANATPHLGGMRVPGAKGRDGEARWASAKSVAMVPCVASRGTPANEGATITKRTLWGTLGVVAMGAAGVASLSLLDEWVGDWGASLWLVGAFMMPFLTGIAWGGGATGRRAVAAGAAVGALVVLAPGLGYALVRGPDLAELRLPLLWAVFTPLAMAQGAITLPIGGSARRR